MGYFKEKTILVAYAQTYANTFLIQLLSKKLNARQQAAEIGRRALSYFLKAQAFDKIHHFASHLVLLCYIPIFMISYGIYIILG